MIHNNSDSKLPILMQAAAAKSQSSDWHSGAMVQRLSHWHASRWHRVARPVECLKKIGC